MKNIERKKIIKIDLEKSRKKKDLKIVLIIIHLFISINLDFQSSYGILRVKIKLKMTAVGIELGSPIWESITLSTRLPLHSDLINGYTLLLVNKVFPCSILIIFYI